MSKALKAFDKVTVLKADGSNWNTWKSRVEQAAKSIKYHGYLTTEANSENGKEMEEDLLNAIIGRLADGIFR